MRKLSFFFLLAIAGTVYSCKSEDKKTEEPIAVDQESIDAIQEMLNHDAGRPTEWTKSDSIIFQSYEEDKTTISTAEYMKDTTVSTIMKNLYINEAREKMAVVFAMRSKGKMGEALLQKEGSDSIRLPQTKALGVADAEFSNGSTTLTTNGNVLTVKTKTGTEIFKRIE